MAAMGFYWTEPATAFSRDFSPLLHQRFQWQRVADVGFGEPVFSCK